jgi:hypothetical protein
MKTVATFFNLSEAGFAQSLLVGDGIAAELQNVESSVNLSGGLPSFQVIVPEADFDRALITVRSLSVEKKTTPVRTLNVSEKELSVFRAIVKGIGVYQLITGFSEIIGVLFESMDIKHVGLGSISRQGEYVAWAIYHFCVALVLIFGTDYFCRLAFPARSVVTNPKEGPNQSTDPTSASGTPGAEHRARHP